MDTKALEGIGLTKGEISVYLALLEIGACTAGDVIKKAGIQNSVFHFCINRLIEKGIASYVKKGKVRVYKAADPENFLSYLKDKEKEIEEILPELKSRQKTIKEKEDVEIFEGINGIISLLNFLIEGAKSGDEFLFFPPYIEEKNEEIQKFYERYDWKRKKKGLVVKGIAPNSLKDLFSKRKYLKMKFTNFPIPENIGMCNDKMAMISWGEKPKGILIQSKQIVEKERKFFNKFWNIM
ncbi:MAG TPA: helix-turn-helix domain-containing protein [archaeon]|nr:helix-turn-helix domain-containing protein [archaeon]